MPTKLTCAFLCAAPTVLLLVAVMPLRAETGRARRFAASAHFGLGSSPESGDPAAQALL